FLTIRTVVTTAAGQYNAPDRGPTHRTWLPLTSINAMLELEESFFSIGVHVIGNRRSAQSDRLTKHLPHRSVQLAQLLARDGCGSAAGAGGCPKQRLVGIDVAYPAQQLLVQKRALDRSLAPAKDLDE